MTDRWLLAAALDGLVGLGLLCLRRRSPLDLAVLALVSTGLVGAFYPVGASLVDPTSWRVGIGAAESEVVGAQIDYLACAAGLLASCGVCALLLRPSRVPSGRGSSAAVLHRDRWCSWILLAGGAALYSGFVARVGFDALLDHEDYARKYLKGEGLGVLYAGIEVMVLACLWAEGGALPARSKMPFRIAAAAIAAWCLAGISVRAPLVLLIGGYAAIAASRRGLTLGKLRLPQIAAALAALLLLESFSLFRGAYHGDVPEAIGAIAAEPRASFASVVGGSELSHPFLTTLEVREAGEAGELGGLSYWNAVPALIPQAIHPTRPLTLSESFVQMHYLRMHHVGAGTAFSFVGEAWLNFGPLAGPFAVALCLGCALGWIQSRRARRPDGLAARMAPALVYLVVILHRTEFAGILKELVTLGGAGAIAWLAAETAWLAAGSRSSAPSPDLLERASP